jgi:molybdopterin-guanine dinucleotide biosynthesis protein A
MSAIVVAGGGSSRFGHDKGLVELAEKPLVLHLVDKLLDVSDEVVVVVNSNQQATKFAAVIRQKAYIVADAADVQTPLAGALVGFDSVHSEYTLLLACDTPFLSPQILSLLMDICVNKSAAIPKWPNGNIEPLCAAYHVERAVEAARKALNRGKLDMRSMIAEMRSIRYISTLVLQQRDPELLSFFNINTPSDLKRAEAIIDHGSASVFTD